MKAMKLPLKKRPALAVVALALFGTTVACADKSAGNALPDPSNADNAPSRTAADPFNGLDSCKLIDNALQGQGFPVASVNKIGGDNGCGADKTQFGGVTLVLQPNLGIADLNVDKSKQHAGDVNGRPSIQTREAIGAARQCDIAMEVTKTSRAFVVVALSTGTTDDACNFAYDVAMKVEPQLPKGN